MNMKLKKILDDIQKTEDKIAELQEHLKRQNTLKQQMEDMEIIKSFRSMKLGSRCRSVQPLRYIDSQSVGTDIRLQ